MDWVAQPTLAVMLGAVVGLSLGLTGGGGSIFAVPLLVYALAVEPRTAVSTSLATVGLTALVGAAQRMRTAEVEVRPGLVFAAAGMVGAPLGHWLGAQLPDKVLLLLFAGLMVVIATRMWRRARRTPEETRAVRAHVGAAPPASGGLACRRDPSGRLRLSSMCFAVIIAAGLATGVLSGAFGVGGGFLIVPALAFVTAMNIHHAVATSLLVIALVSASGIASYAAAGVPIEMQVAAPFAAGGVAGMLAGTLIGRRISGPTLQRVFAAAIVVVATFVIGKNVA